LLPLGDMWDTLLGGGLAGLLLAAAKGFMLVYRGRGEIRKDDRDDIVKKYQELLDRGDKKFGEQEKRNEEVLLRLGIIEDKERECTKKFDRLFIIAQTYGMALKAAGIAVPPIPQRLEDGLGLHDDKKEEKENATVGS
jgi:hypothetical protein